MTTNIPIEQIKPNPWQPRTSVDPVAIAELADSIRHQGLLQPPIARSVDGHYELAFGHRRLLAWKNVYPGDSMPVEIMELTDRQMAEMAATENAARLGLNPIERARAVKRMIDEFELTQIEAGKLFGLASQGGVSNVLRVLALPKDVLKLVSDGQLAERHARALLPLMLLPNAAEAAVKIAQRVAQAKDKDREETLDNLAREACHKAGGIFMNDAPWKLKWPARNLPAPEAAAKGAPAEIPPCRGCRYLATVDKMEMCLRPACYKARLHLFAIDEAQRASKRLGIAVAAPGEKVVIVFGEKQFTDWNERVRCQRLVGTKEAKPLLRLVPLADAKKSGSFWERKEVTGSELLLLATVNKTALDRLEPAKRAVSQDAHQRQYKAKDKARQDRAKECKRLCLAAAPHFAAALPDSPALLDLLMNRFAGQDVSCSADEAAFKKAVGNDKRAYLARLILLSAIPHYHWSTESTPHQALKKLRELATALKIKLPAGWDAVPDPEVKKPAIKKPAAKTR